MELDISPQNFIPLNDSLLTPSNCTSTTPFSDDILPVNNTGNLNDDEAFKVFVRIRPLNKKESEKKIMKKHINIVKLQDRMLFILDTDTIPTTSNIPKEKSYAFDYIFCENDNTPFVYENTMEPLLDNILNGFNATLFAYGMTGAGKTYTLFGDIQKDLTNIDTCGMIMLTFRDLFQKISQPPYSNSCEFVIKLSYLEIYNEHVRDLIKGDNQNLMIIEDPIKGTFVAELLEVPVYTVNDVLNFILLGNSKRIMASTSANQFSSRSHAIIQVIIEKKNKALDSMDTSTLSKLSLIDLAGSERASVNDTKGIRMLEGANINRSLLSLGNCINILSDQTKKGAFVPYRDSKLTRLLKDSLGGNTKTIMIACVSPCYSCYEETINTLKYASRAKSIKRKVLQNIKEVELDVSQYKEIIEGLKEEIRNLREELKAARSPITKILCESKESTMMGINTNGFAINTDSFRQKNIKSIEFNKNSQLEDTSNKIFENLEQNFEINQSLRELNKLEHQNQQALLTLQNMLQANLDIDDPKKLESIKNQILSLKNTMENNEKLKKDFEDTLKLNLMENKMLRDKLTVYSLSVDNYEDIQIMNRLLDIEKMDIHKQNVEIKKELLSLTKEKIIKNKQISQLEEELRTLRRQIEEKDRIINSNKDIIDNLLKSKNSIKLQFNQSSIKDPNAIETINNSQNQTQQETTTTSSKSSMLRKLLSNLENHINKSFTEMDEMINAPVKNLLMQINHDTSIRSARSRTTICEMNKIINLDNSLQNYDPIPRISLNSCIEINYKDKTDENQSDDMNPESNRLKLTLPPPCTLSRIQKSSQEVPKRKDFMEMFAQNRKQQSLRKGYFNPTLDTDLNQFSQFVSLSPENRNQAVAAGLIENPLPKATASNSQEFLLPYIQIESDGKPGFSHTPLLKDNLITSPIQTQNDQLNGICSQEKFNAEENSLISKSKSPITRENDQAIGQKLSLKHLNKIVDKLSIVETFKNQIKQRQLTINCNLNSKNTDISSSTSCLDNSADSVNNFEKSNQKQSQREKSSNPSANLNAAWSRNSMPNTTKGNILMPPLPTKLKYLQSPRTDNNISIEQQKRLFDIRSLDQERENLKLFRSKLQQIITMNLKENNITESIFQEIKALLEEYQQKNYSLSITDQESLRILCELTDKLQTIDQNQVSRGRCASAINTKNNIGNEFKSATTMKPIPFTHNQVQSTKSITKTGKKSFFSHTSNAKTPTHLHNSTKDPISIIPPRNSNSLVNEEKMSANLPSMKRGISEISGMINDDSGYLSPKALKSSNQSFRLKKGIIDDTNDPQN